MKTIISLVLSVVLILSAVTPAVAVPTAAGPDDLPVSRPGLAVDSSGTAAVVGPDEPNNDFDTAVLVGSNQPATVFVGPGDVDVYAVSAPPDQLTPAPFAVDIDRSAGFGTVAVVVYGPDREQLTYEYVSSDAPIRLQVSPVETGTHYVQFVPLAQATGTFQLTIVADQAPPTVGEPDDDPSVASRIERGESTTGTVDVPADADWYRFESDGTGFEFVFSRQAGGSGTLGVMFYDGETLLPANDPPFPLTSGDSVTASAQLPPGTYYIVVASSDRGTDDYTVEYVDTSLARADGREASTLDDGSATERLDAPRVAPVVTDGPMNQYIIYLPELAELPKGDREAVVASLKAHAVETQAPAIRALEANDVRVVNTFWLANAVVVEVDPERLQNAPAGAEEWLERVVPDAEKVVANEPVWTIEGLETAVPDDDPTEAGLVWTVERGGAAEVAAAPPATVSTETTGIRTTYGLEQVRATDVWDEFGTRGAGVTVAVIDSGVDVSHPDIDLYTSDPTDPTYPGGWVQYDFEGRPVQGAVPTDPIGHGTHVSATVAGGATGGVAIGVAPDVRLLHAGVGVDGRITAAGVLAGMQWATEHGADIITMSLGSDSSDPNFVLPTRQAAAAGVLLVTSSGNSGPDVVGTPADLYDFVTVGAAGPTERILPWSSGTVIDTGSRWGAVAPADWPDQYVVPTVSGPGGGVLSAKTVDTGYVAFSGTSMSAPHVAGVAALLIASTDRPVSPREVRDALVATARKPSGAPADPDTRYGAGLVDALAAARLLNSAPDPTSPTPAPETGPDATPSSRSPPAAPVHSRHS